MDSAEERNVSQWVQGRVRELDPPAEWEPASHAALARIRARAAAERAWWGRRWGWRLAASVSLICLVVVMWPAGRGVTQRLWDLWQVQRLDVLRLDLDKLPASLSAQAWQKSDGIVPVRDVAEAAQRAGFAPRLPRAGLFPGDPYLSVMGPWAMGLTVDVADLRRALVASQVSDRTVPATWEGAQIGLHIGAIVSAEYPEVTLMQALPFTMTTPHGFDFAAFSETLLRIAGLGPGDARTFGAQMATMPFLFFPIEPDDIVAVRQVDLRTGRGTLLHDLDEEGVVVRVTLLWSVSDRLYMLSANASDDVMIAAANSLE